MSCGGGCCQRKSYNSNKPLSKRIPQVVLVLFIVWLIGFGCIAQAFNQPTRKSKNRKRNNKKRYNRNKNSGFFGKLSDGLHSGNQLIWALLIFIILLTFILLIRVIRIQAKKLERNIQDKWEEAMAEQQRRYTERMKGFYEYDDEDDDDDDYNGPRIRELETEEEEAHWRSLMEKERKERERKIAAAAAENSDDEEKKTR